MILDLFTTIGLTVSEEERLGELEGVIGRGLKTFVDVGGALLEIRDSRLYRKEHATFEDYCQKRWNMQRNYANKLIAAADAVLDLGTKVPILPTTETQSRPLTSLPKEERVQVWQQVVDTAPTTGITAAHVQSVVDEYKGKPHVANNSGNNEWYTPLEYIDAARRVMGGIDLDPASSETANRTVKAPVYFTAEDDGLQYAWDGRVWMNPPYAAGLVDQFADKLAKHYQAGEVTQAIVLVNNATETVWFQTMLECAAAVCFIRRRVRFIDIDGNPSGAPLQGQAILYMGSEVEKFAEVFGQFGKVMYG